MQTFAAAVWEYNSFLAVVVYMYALCCLSPMGLESAAVQELRCPSVHVLTRSCDPQKGMARLPSTPSISSAWLDDQRASSSIRANSMPHESVSAPTQAEISKPHESVAGILYKWVNFGKGWRPRWFVLKEGVLSYYKVHGPDKITLRDEKHTISRIIGEESQKLIKKQKNIQRPRKSFGEVHLQVGHFSLNFLRCWKFFLVQKHKAMCFCACCG